MCCEQCNMLNYKGIVLLLSEMKLVLRTPGETANVHIDLFYNALLAPFKSLKISKLAAPTRNPERKDVECSPTNMEC